MLSWLKKEALLLLAAATAVAGYMLEHAVIHAGAAAIGLAFVIIIAVIMGAAFRVAYHAEVLAHRLGEPYGTMILTIAAVTVEVVMLAILMADGHSPTLARDTVYSAVMLDMNGIIGIAAIIGGLRHGEQKYNLDASNTYISMLLVALGISMFIPDFIKPDAWQAYSVFTIVSTIIIYAVFLRVQTVEHRYFFQYGTLAAVDTEHKHADGAAAPSSTHSGLLVLSIVIIGALAELLSVLLNEGAALVDIPKAVPAVLIALISASPEFLTAIRAAVRDQMQTVINIALGASLATVLLTVPVIETLALIRDQRIEMGLTPLQAAMLLLTVLAAMINLHDGESNVLEGAVHFALFAAFVALTFIVI
jgi:Ca2+:H+ antiporter